MFEFLGLVASGYNHPTTGTVRMFRKRRSNFKINTEIQKEEEVEVPAGRRKETQGAAQTTADKAIEKDLKDIPNRPY